MKKWGEINFSFDIIFCVKEVAEIKGGIKSGIIRSGRKNSFAFVWKDKNDNIIPREEKEKEIKNKIIKNFKNIFKEMGKFRKIVNKKYKIIPEIKRKNVSENTFPR